MNAELQRSCRVSITCVMSQMEVVSQVL